MSLKIIIKDIFRIKNIKIICINFCIITSNQTESHHNPDLNDLKTPAAAPPHLILLQASATIRTQNLHEGNIFI